MNKLDNNFFVGTLNKSLFTHTVSKNGRLTILNNSAIVFEKYNAQEDKTTTYYINSNCKDLNNKFEKLSDKMKDYIENPNLNRMKNGLIMLALSVAMVSIWVLAGAIVQLGFIVGAEIFFAPLMPLGICLGIAMFSFSSFFIIPSIASKGAELFGNFDVSDYNINLNELKEKAIPLRQLKNNAEEIKTELENLKKNNPHTPLQLNCETQIKALSELIEKCENLLDHIQNAKFFGNETTMSFKINRADALLNPPV